MTVDDTRAREELTQARATLVDALAAALLLDDASFESDYISVDTDRWSGVDVEASVDGTLNLTVIARHLLDPEVFGRLAGLLGYVKADSEEWGVRFGAGGAAAMRKDRAEAERVAKRNGLEVVRRQCGPWEVVGNDTDA